MEQIYIIGHKNPDTDSIASALAYAEFKKKTDSRNVIPARAGVINNQTGFILKKLNIPAPVFLADIRTKVSDVMIKNVIFCRENSCLNDALQIFLRSRIQFLPVVNDKKEPVGLLTLETVTGNLLKLLESSKIYTSISLIRKVIRAEAIGKLEKEDELFKGEIILTTGSLENIVETLKRSEKIPKIIVTDDRYSILTKLNQFDIKLIIFANNNNPPHEVVQYARKRKILLLRTPLNSTKATVLLKQSIPVPVFYTKKFSTIHYSKDLTETHDILGDQEQKGIMVLDDQGTLCGIITKGELVKSSSKKAILVDHNEISQAVDGIEQASVIEIVDHHRLSPINTVKPITFINYPVGSTSTIIAMQFKNSCIEPERSTARLLISGILSDTVILRSPTTTRSDTEMVKWLNHFARMDYRQFAVEFFKAGSKVDYKDVEKIIFQDFKNYEAGNSRIGMGQIEIIGFSEFHKHKAKLLHALQKMNEEGDYKLLGLLLTDISIETSLLLILGKDNLLNKLPYNKLNPNLYELKGVISRKQQLMPTLLKMFE
ncbi:MAG: putative manganese-dependent inorganic diphosphatase [bacterium]|nr:putative manganese-dependent inorganic diphosphatase [bacterium]